MKFLSDILAKAGLVVDGVVTLNNVAAATTDTDKFVVMDNGVVKFRTGAQVLSDIGAISAETDTLQSVTNRGATTTNSITAANLFTGGLVVASSAVYSNVGFYSNQNGNLRYTFDQNDLVLKAGTSTSNDYVRVFGATGNVSIGNIIDSGYKLDVTGRGYFHHGVDLRDYAGMNTTYSLIAYTAGNTPVLGVRNGAVEVSGGFFTFNNAPYYFYTNSGYNFYPSNQWLLANQSSWLNVGGNTYTSTNNAGVYAMVNIAPAFVDNGTRANGTEVAGIYYNPSNFSYLGANHFAAVFVTGRVRIGDLGGTGSRMVVADASGVLSTQAIPNAGATSRVIETFTATAGQTVFTITGGYTTGSIDVFLNGSRLTEAAYTATNGTTVVLVDAAVAGDVIDVIKFVNIGSIVVNTDQIAEGVINQYFTNARARAAISLTTTGTSGAATYNSTTGVLNIPQYQAVLTNPVTGTGTTNYLAKFTGTSSIGDSLIFDNGTGVGINTTSISGLLTLAPAANTGALTISGYSLTGSNATPAVDISGTWNTTGTPTLIRANVTDTASSANSLLLDLRTNGVSQFSVRKDGRTTTLTSIANSFQSTGVAGSGIFVHSGTNSDGISHISFAASRTLNWSFPTAGTYTAFLANPTIIQTNATGITRGLFINPTLTNVPDWRAIETTNGRWILTDTYSAGSGSLANPSLDIAATWNTTGTPTLIRANVTNTASNAASLLMDLQTGGTSRFRVNVTGGFVASTESFVNALLNTSSLSVTTTIITGAGSDGSTSGTINAVNFRRGFNPTSGTAVQNSLRIGSIINQTGGANGITRGLFVDATLTAAADWRSIEWSNNTGWGLYGVGTAANYLAGNLLINTTTNSGFQLDVNGVGRFNGAVTLRNSATSTADFLAKPSFSVDFNGNYWNSATGNVELYTGSIFGIPNASNVASAPSTRIVIRAGVTDVANFMSTGNVLIGTSTLLGNGANTNPLQVYGGVTIAAQSGVFTYATLQYSGTDFVITGNAHPANLGVNNIIFRTGTSGGGGPQEWMRIRSDGNVGIGTTLPSYTLQIGQHTAGNNTDYGLAILRHGDVNTSGTYTTTPALLISEMSNAGPSLVDTTGIFSMAFGRFSENMTNAANATLVHISYDGNLGPLRIDGRGNMWIGYNRATLPTNSGTFGLLVRNGLAVGSGYQSNTPPTNGAIIAGNTGIGTSTPNARLAVVSSTDGNVIEMARTNGAYFWKFGIDSSSNFFIANNGNNNHLTINPNTGLVTMLYGMSVFAGYHATKVFTFGPTSAATINLPVEFPSVFLVSGNTWAVFGRCNLFSSTGAVEVREFYIGRSTGGTWSAPAYNTSSNTGASLQSVTASGDSITINMNSGNYLTVEITVMIR